MPAEQPWCRWCSERHPEDYICDMKARGRVKHPEAERMLRWFEYDHLPPNLRDVSEPFHRLATRIADTIPGSAERTVALRKLLESKDAAVRASLP